tara:strand:- start:297 stop:743 length:447 start_codon:yes stop_codon:yes gene_type:complete
MFKYKTKYQNINNTEINNIINTLVEKLEHQERIISKQKDTINKYENYNKKKNITSVNHFMLNNRDKFHNKIDFLYHLQGGCCCYCNRKINIADITKEHIIPKSLGGTEAIGNISLSCYKCNNKRKNDMTNDKTISIILNRMANAWWIK